MVLISLAGATAGVGLLGRWMFGRWFNHVTLYGATWGFTLLVFHSGLIQYYPLETETWMLIAAAAAAFVLGSASVCAARFSTGKQGVFHQPYYKNFVLTDKERQALHNVLWFLNTILIVHTAYEVYNVTRLLGGDITNIIALANLLYDIRVRETIPGSIPYVGSLVFFAAVLSAVYTSSVGKLKLVAFIPFLLAVVISFVQVVRALALIVAILFISAYFLNRKKIEKPIASPFGTSVKRVLALLFLIALLIATVEVVRTTRGLYERFAGQSAALRTLSKSEMGFISPSVIMYLSVHNGVLNQYLKQEEEKVIWGRYTFAPLWRVLSKFGFETYVGFYQQWSYPTPVSANTGTYIRELHADFGLGGVILVPYLLGLISSFYWYRVQEKNTLSDITILAHLYAVVGMSWFVMLTQLAGWMISLASGIIITRILERRAILQTDFSVER